MLHSPDHNPQSATEDVLTQLELNGAKPPLGETDHRLMPDMNLAEGCIEALFDATISLMRDSQLEDDLEDVQWALANIFHRRSAFTQKRLDDVEGEIRLMLDCQDGSEVKSGELERLQTSAEKLTAHRDAYEDMREYAAVQFLSDTGSVWMPRSGNRVQHKSLTASVIDSRSYLAAQKVKDTQTLCPEGTRIAFAGGIDYQDHTVIWQALDATRTKYPDMVLLHGGAKKGAEFIASKWADNKKVAQVIFKPDWASHNRAAPFKRNDEILKVMPQGLIATPGSGVTENLVDKARKLGIRVLRIGA